MTNYPLALGVQHIGRVRPHLCAIHALGQHQHVSKQKLGKPMLVKPPALVAMARADLSIQPTAVRWRRYTTES